MITLENLSYTIGSAKIINHISLEIDSGDFVAIIGENGAGKTTITKLMAGLLKPSGGKVFIGDKDTKKMRAKEIASTLSYLFQNPDKQICQNTVEEELLFGLNILEADSEEKNRRLAEVLARFHLDPKAAPFSLSRGQRQMLTFASVMIMRPSILILDEPTTGLDYGECMLMMGLVKELNEAGTTVIMVSHDMEVVSDFAQKILVLHQGQLLDYDDCNQVMRKEEILRQASVMPSQIIALATYLGGEYANCTTVDELAEAIESGCR